MPTVNYNPGEPVFDMTTGEPYIAEDGALIEVEPGLKVSDLATGRTLDGDDVANAAYYRANLFLGESTRDRSAGVPYFTDVLGSVDQRLAASTVAGTVAASTPGVVGIVAVRVGALDPTTRVLEWTGVVLRADGSEQALATNTALSGV